MSNDNNDRQRRLLKGDYSSTLFHLGRDLRQLRAYKAKGWLSGNQIMKANRLISRYEALMMALCRLRLDTNALGRQYNVRLILYRRLSMVKGV